MQENIKKEGQKPFFYILFSRLQENFADCRFEQRRRTRVLRAAVNASQIKDLERFDMGAVAKSKIWTSTPKNGDMRNFIQSYSSGSSQL